MTLKPERRPARTRRMAVYDLEWVPGENTRPGWEPMALRLVGVYDGVRYRSYTSIEEFLNNELTAKTSGAWMFAHYGGMADIQYVLEYIIKHGRSYTVEAAFSGSAAIIVTIRRGKLVWTFCDSFWLIRESLRKIGQWTGLAKGGSESSLDMFYATIPELRDYNEQDCRILHRALVILENVVLDLGGELQKTIASTAMNLFRRRYLRQEIATSEAVNETARQAYVASRVEPFAKTCGFANAYDINSAFPHAMLSAAPGNLIERTKRLPDRGTYLAHALVHVPDMYVPPLPYRAASGRVFFPTGTWDAWLMSEDVKFLLECGGRILRVYEVLTFEPFTALADYAQDLYERRRRAKDQALTVIYKYLLNSLYGKTAESSLKTSMLVNPASTTPKEGEKLVMYRPGVYMWTRNIEVPHAHVPIAAHITAYARANLGRHMRQCSEIYYVDTDAFSSPDVRETSDQLGGLKLEKRMSEGHFAGPKLYAWKDADSGNWTVKAKGFRRLTIDEYLRLTSESKPKLPAHRMHRFKELLRRPELKPSESDVMKGVNNVFPKRCVDGANSRAWRVDELE